MTMEKPAQYAAVHAKPSFDGTGGTMGRYLGTRGAGLAVFLLPPGFAAARATQPMVVTTPPR